MASDKGDAVRWWTGSKLGFQMLIFVQVIFFLSIFVFQIMHLFAPQTKNYQKCYNIFFVISALCHSIPGMQLTSPWNNVTEAEDNVTFYLTVYGSLAGANSVFTLLRAFLFAYGGISAAKVLHTRLLSSVLKVKKQRN